MHRLSQILALTILAMCGVFALPVRAEDLTDLTTLVGKTIDLELQAGKQVPDSEVTKVLPGQAAGSIRSLSVRSGKSAKVQTVAAAGIVEIYMGGKPLDVVYDKKSRTLSHSPVKREARLKHEAVVNERLASQRQRLWPELSEKEHEDWIAQHRAFVEDAKGKMGGKSLALVETKYYLFSKNSKT